ncbi:unnamed protein product [Acanthoscelides obtectus]|uniref:Uncharacterized protein n=1 Tax=Acanthoscelides obtectus TaxID=200917 RepID=A0A9P0KIT5_ACAOB|nr:unnamed protein product [Acanthoscelides obtectus]CAK1664838.1 hypothetical protein AOBTE_LOCUS24499 [Acanthoscelides obtectus]
MFAPYMMSRSMQVTLTPSKESSSEAHSSQGSPVRKRLRMEELAIPGPSHVVSSHIPFPDEASKMVEPPEILQSFTSSSTATASEQEYQLAIRGNVTKRNVSTPRKRRLKRYVGDLSSDDFSTPRKSKSNYRLMKSSLMTLRKKVKSLQTSVAALRRRIKTLSGLLKLLKQKNHITDSAETVLKVSRLMKTVCPRYPNSFEWSN